MDSESRLPDSSARTTGCRPRWRTGSSRGVDISSSSTGISSRGTRGSSRRSTNPGRGGEHQVAWCLPEILRLLWVPGQCSNEGPDLRPVYEESGGCVGSKDPTDVGGLQRAGGELAEGDPVSLLARRSRTRGWPFRATRGRSIRAAPGTGFGATTTGSAFSAHYNPRGTTDRSTIRLNSSTGGDTFSTGGSINAHHPRPHSTGAHSGLPEYK